MLNKQFYPMPKLIVVVLLVIFYTGISKADDSRYTNAMKKNITQIDSLKDLESMVSLTNSFLRIANAEKDKWLPYYYASYLSVITSYSDTVKNNKDSYLDLADKYIALADSLQPDESEIYVLKGMIMQARLQIDPMSRFMKYGNAMNAAFKKAAGLDPSNPRPDYLLGMNLYYTPEAFGGGPKVAKPLFDSSIKKFNEFVPKDELMPTWGKGNLEAMLERINQ